MSILHKKAFGGLLFLFLVMAALLFIPAWTLDYWQASTFLAVYFASSLAITFYLVKKDPGLLQRRLRGGPAAEKQISQKIIMSFTSLGFVGLLVIPALDHRFGWSHIVPRAALAGDALVALGWLAIFFVFRENTFSSATIELAPDQKVISTLRARSAPDVCGRHFHASRHTDCARFVVGLLIVVAMMPALIWRLFDEEKLLAGNLPGYVEYQNKVRYRLIPLVW
jgi:protein-S-isoprenylcysteine O-methyltransferase Ste14